MTNRVRLIAFAVFIGWAGAVFAQPRNTTASKAGDVIGWLICAGVGGLVALGVYIAMTVYMYKDARRRGMDRLLWLLLGLFFNPVAWLVYICVRSPLPARPPKDEPDDVEDDRPRRRRRDEEDDEDPPPRRRRDED